MQSASGSPEPQSNHPFHVMVKPIGPICNLDCEYCFYLEKENLYPEKETWRMSEATLKSFIRQYIEAQSTDEVNFAWQGGEPTLLGVDFFQKAVKYQKSYGKNRKITNALQTNATLINDEWATFLAENNFLVGVSIDGPKKFHDAYRVSKGNAGTFDDVMKGIRILQKNKVEFNTLTCVNRLNSQKPMDVYRFLRGIGSRFMQFIPIVERKPDRAARDYGLSLASPPAFEGDKYLEPDSPVTPWSVKAKDYGNFLIQIFDRWVIHDVGRYFIQIFDVAFAKWLRFPGGLCIFDETCGRALAMEHDGNLYSCDHFVYPDYFLGNVMDDSMQALANSSAQEKFGNNKQELLPRYCRECSVKFACNGGCPKQRFLKTPGDGEPGLNYLCAGYKAFFTHCDPYLRTMANLYQSKKPPAAIMELIRSGELKPG